MIVSIAANIQVRFAILHRANICLFAFTIWQIYHYEESYPCITHLFHFHISLIKTMSMVCKMMRKKKIRNLCYHFSCTGTCTLRKIGHPCVCWGFVDEVIWSKIRRVLWNPRNERCSRQHLTYYISLSSYRWANARKTFFTEVSAVNDGSNATPTCLESLLQIEMT